MRVTGSLSHSTMQTCIDPVGQRVISASHLVLGKQLLCVRCHKAVHITGQIPLHFSHVETAGDCQADSLHDTPNVTHGVADGSSDVLSEQWNVAWRKMIDGAVHRGSMVQYHIHDDAVHELEESCFCVVNATSAILFAYTGFSLEGKSVFFCQKSWVHTSKRHRTLLHCCDGRVRELCTESAVCVRISDGSVLSVHIVRDTQICARCVCVQLATKDCLPHFNPSPSTECIIHLFTRVMPNLYITANLAASVAGTARRAMAGACKYASL